MYKIVEARSVGFKIKQFVIEAPRIARKQRPGQFIILRLHENGERIPLTIKSSDPEAGTVTIVVQSIGKTTSLLNCLETGDYILDIVGPLGHPSEIENFGTVAILAGSVGTAMALPTANALKQAGNHVVFIEGARNTEMVVFEDEVRAGQQRNLHHDRRRQLRRTRDWSPRSSTTCSPTAARSTLCWPLARCR